MKNLICSSASFDLCVTPPCGHQQVIKRHEKARGTAHGGHFFTAAISKFIETDWFLQIIVKLILPLNMKLERGMDAQWAGPNIKTGGSWLTVKMFCDQYYQPKEKKIIIICTRALKSAQNKTGVKTGQVFLII